MAVNPQAAKKIIAKLDDLTKIFSAPEEENASSALVAIRRTTALPEANSLISPVLASPNVTLSCSWLSRREKMLFFFRTLFTCSRSNLLIEPGFAFFFELISGSETILNEADVPLTAVDQEAVVDDARLSLYQRWLQKAQ